MKRDVLCPGGHNEWRYREDQDKWFCCVCSRDASKQKQRVRRRDPCVALYDMAKRRASDNMTAFTIGIEDIRKAWPADGKCPALGLDLVQGKGYSGDCSPTLDRLNDRWGYEPGNIAVLSHKANRAKGRLQAQELEAIAAWMRRNGLD